MLKFTPLVLAIIYALVMYRFSVWNTKRELDAKSRPLVDMKLGHIQKRLAEALDVPRVNVFLYEVDAVNALAAPDGRIFVTRGFYEKFHNGQIAPEEMASVIAHELGHVALGHTRRRMIDFAAQNALRSALTMIVARFIPGIGPMIATGLTRIFASRMSHGDEYEADAYATALMIKAGYGTEPQKSLFRKLDKITGTIGGAHGASVPAWFTSHPKSAERIKAIEANEAKWRD